MTGTSRLPLFAIALLLGFAGCGGSGAAHGTTYWRADFQGGTSLFMAVVRSGEDVSGWAKYGDGSFGHYVGTVNSDGTYSITAFGGATVRINGDKMAVTDNEHTSNYVIVGESKYKAAGGPAVTSTSGGATSKASTTSHTTAESSETSTGPSQPPANLSFSSLRALRYPRSVNIDALSGRTLLPGCRFDPAEHLGYENRVILRCTDLGAESSGFIKDTTEHLNPVRLDCGSEERHKLSGTLWHCTTVAGSVDIEAYALSQRDVALRYAALVKIADANP